ncbi:S53 family peptidase [Kutzneria sp. NPDC051319]|uniref:S53 family peptidase n=1 Tax=Kutzneria sp. NPDC051319 TaxID=3155047 RepID=UPI00341C08F5
MRFTGRRLTAGFAVTPLVLAAAAVITPAAQAATPAVQPGVYALPTGDHVRIHGDRADFLPAPGHSAAAVTTWLDGRPTVVPASAIGHISSLDAFEIGGAKPAAAHPDYAMAPLHITALDHEGKPVQAAEVVVINTDDPGRAMWDGLMFTGDSRIAVPAGHYSVAVAAFETDAKDNPTETELLTATDVTVPTAGAAVALDGRKASPVSFTTPLPSVDSATVVGWNRGVGTKLAILDIGALAGTRFYVGQAAKAKYGTLQYSVAGRRTSPAAAIAPYSYALATPKTDSIGANQTYAVKASSLATIDNTYVTDQPSQDAIYFDDFALHGQGTGNPALPSLPYLPVKAPSADRHYVSTDASFDYDATFNPNGAPYTNLDRVLPVKPGQHVSLAWRGGVVAPAPSTVDGPCFLCRDGDTLHGVGVMDTDYSGNIGQWSDGPTTLSEDGKQIYSGGTEGYEFDQQLAAGKHRYVYNIDATHDTNVTALSTHTQIAWGFDSTTSTGPVPILYAGAGFSQDKHDSIAPGKATVSLSFHHQSGTADPDVTKATADVSYDDGTTWQPTTVTLTDGHHATGAFTVPAGAKPGYLALRFHAVDQAGSTLDETVHNAALVNAPNGIATAPSNQDTQPAADVHPVCANAARGHARCLALSATAKWQPSSAKLPDGLSPADIKSAYTIPADAKGGTVAIVDNGGDDTAEADLAVYRETYGLPACTTANGCLTILNQDGKSSPLPPVDPEDDWTDEISLDLDMVSAVCPACHIVLVESTSSDTVDLAKAETAATGSGATAVSNSWGGDEDTEDMAHAKDFTKPGVAITASTGDAGFKEASWPASLSTVIAVGGTSLTKASNARGWTESAWKGAGSGCSGYVAKPSWQKDKNCPNRTIADISAVADPATGPAVYSSGDWYVSGGTSASSPIIAAMVVLAGNSAKLANAKYIYQHPSALNDVTSGSNKHWDCGGDYLCTAGKGYDGPTGLGTPNGLGAL